MNPQIAVGQAYEQTVAGQDASGNPLPLLAGSMIASLSAADYVYAFVGTVPLNSNGAPESGAFAVMQKAVPLGTTKTVTVTINAKSPDGTALPPQTVAIDCVGAPPPEQATEIVLGTPTIAVPGNVPVDPGAPSLTIN